MAIRYSGDVEIRLTYDPRYGGAYRVHVRSPGFRRRLALTPRQAGLSRKRGEALSSPEAYDQAAEAALMLVEVEDGLLPVEVEEKGTPGEGIVVRRVFQSACPRR